MKEMFALLLVLSSSAILLASAGRKEAWGYVNVRRDAHMFWWLYYTDISADYANYPLVLWLSGGPGGSSVGDGNFMGIGPLDVNLKHRNETWLKKANLLFIDNPVGTGFSYVTNKSALATTNRQIALDLVTTLSSILQTVPEFQKSPLYVFGESYGGKMAVDFALELSKAIKSTDISCNFKGIALGDAWISASDFVSSYGTFLYATSFLDSTEVESLKLHVNDIQESLATGQSRHALDVYRLLQEAVANLTHSVDWFNILEFEQPYASSQSNNKISRNHRFYSLFDDEPSDAVKLSELMNGKIREKLQAIPKHVTWGGQAIDVVDALSEDIMKPVIDSVDTLLINEPHLDVNVYTGQFDLTANIIGTLQWVEKLKWPGMTGYKKATKKSMDDGPTTGGFVKSFEQFTFFWILKAGHMVPIHTPVTALKMLDMIISKDK